MLRNLANDLLEPHPSLGRSRSQLGFGRCESHPSAANSMTWHVNLFGLSHSRDVS